MQACRDRDRRSSIGDSAEKKEASAPPTASVLTRDKTARTRQRRAKGSGAFFFDVEHEDLLSQYTRRMLTKQHAKELQKRKLTQARVVDDPPFRIVWAHGFFDRTEQGFVPQADGTLVPLRGFAGFSALLAQALVDPRKSPDTIFLALRHARIELYEDRVAVQVMCSGAGSHAPASPALLDRWEPPHAEGDAFSFVCGFFSDESDARQTVFRVVVDSSCNVHTEVIGEGPLPIVVNEQIGGGRRRPGVIGGRDLLDDAGEYVLPQAPQEAEKTEEATADWWRQQARLELASVASFSRAALELLAVGGPLRLVAALHEAARDELRHTQVCLDVARSLDGRDLSLGAVPALAPRDLDIAGLARTTYDEACVPETLAAVLVTRAAAVVRDPEFRAVMEALAADERRHARLAWDIHAWCRKP